MNRIHTLCLALIALAACRAAEPAAVALPYEVLAAGSRSGEHRAGASLFTNEADWQAFWQRHAGWRIPAEPAPRVDFERQSVIVLCAGDEPTPGWELETLSVARADGRIQVVAALHAPAGELLQAQVLTQPFQILLVPRTSGAIELELAQRESTR